MWKMIATGASSCHGRHRVGIRGKLRSPLTFGIMIGIASAIVLGAGAFVSYIQPDGQAAPQLIRTYPTPDPH